MSNRHLVIVAHPDDEVLGFGATGAKLVLKGDIVKPVMLSGRVDARLSRPSDDELLSDLYSANEVLGFEKPVLGRFPNIKMNTVAHLDLVQFIEGQIAEFQPTHIYTHSPNDLNNDHLQVSNACLAASRLFQRRQDIVPLDSLYFIEIPSSTDWGFPGPTSFQPNIYEEIDGYLDLKLKALACYRNVMREYPHPRSKEAITGLAAVRGAESGLHYAEAFQLVFKRGI